MAGLVGLERLGTTITPQAGGAAVKAFHADDIAKGNLKPLLDADGHRVNIGPLDKGLTTDHIAGLAGRGREGDRGVAIDKDGNLSRVLTSKGAMNETGKIAGIKSYMRTGNRAIWTTAANNPLIAASVATGAIFGTGALLDYESNKNYNNGVTQGQALAQQQMQQQQMPQQQPSYY